MVIASLTRPLAQYADPLMPRRPVTTQTPASHNFSPEMEKRLQGLIAKIKSSGRING